MFQKGSPLVAIFLIVLVDILALTLVIPYLPFYAEKFGAGPTEVGLIITVFAFCQFISGPILGRMSDQMGRKPILILSQIGTAFGFVVLALAQNLWMVYLARVIDGITAGNITVAQAAISDVVAPKDRAKAFSLIGVAFSLGFFMGPAISGILLHFGTSAPAWGATFFSLLSVLFTTLFFKDSENVHHAKIPFRLDRSLFTEIFNFKPHLHYLKNKNLRELLLQFFCFNLSFSSYISCFALFAERKLIFQGAPFGPKEVGYLFAYLGLLGILIRSFLITRLIETVGERKTSHLGFLAQGLGYASYAFVSTVPEAILASTLASIGSGLIRPSLAALTSRQVGPKEQGALFGVNQSLASIASIVAPLMAGLLIAKVSLSAWALFSGFSVLISFFFIYRPESTNAAQSSV